MDKPDDHTNGDDAHRFEVKMSRRPGTVIATVRGNLVQASAKGLRRLLFDRSRCDQPLIVVDLDEVTQIDAAAIGCLIAARRWLQAHHATLCLVIDPSSTLAQVFALNPLRTALPVCDSLRDALEGATANTGYDKR